jgi:hypothetical protein
MINVQNISSKLASLPDQALKQYAEMHKEDPYVFSLALSESNRRKQLRMQTQQPEPQPKVVDKELAEMDVRKALPEDLGIARIPVDMNMASGGIVAFGDGGMAHYDKGGDVRNAGSDPKLAYRQYALTQANKIGLDPALVDTIFQIESGYNPEAVSPKGAVGIGQLMPKTAAGRNVKDSTDPYQNIDASLQELKSLQKKYDNDTTKIAAAYNWGQGNLDKHLNKNDGEINPAKLPNETRNYIKKITDLIPISSANAEVAPVAAPAPAAQQEADRSFTGQLKDIGGGITGLLAPQGAGGYAPGTRNFFERAADRFGVGEETQRNFSNTLNALPGVNVLKAPKAVGGLSAAAQAAREAEIAAAAAKAEAAAGKVANLRLPAPAPQGIATLPRSATAPPVAPRTTFQLSPESVEMNQKIQASRQAQQLRNLEADKAAAEAARTGVTTATNAAQTSEAIEMANAARAANMANKVISPANKAVNTARQVQALRVGSDMPSVAEENQPSYKPDETQNLLDKNPVPASPAVDDRTKRDPANYKPEEKKQIVAAAKDAVPKTEDTDGWSKNDWLQFGLSLMAGQSPYALSNIGAAGLAVISAKAEKAKEQNKLDLYKSVNADKPGQSIQIAERLMAADPKLTFEQALAKTTSLIGGSTKDDLADIKADLAKNARIKTYQDGMKAIEGSMTAILGKSATATPAQKKEYQDAIAALGPNPALEGGQQASLTAPSAASALGWGKATKQ